MSLPLVLLLRAQRLQVAPIQKLLEGSWEVCRGIICVLRSNLKSKIRRAGSRHQKVFYNFPASYEGLASPQNRFDIRPVRHNSAPTIAAYVRNSTTGGNQRL